ncbi:hypothetical protein FANTH_14311 [Fusarium anthophilum]|uniref:Retrotransposon gag domain-containing protein n=1 Tax=Fusarium anthophilum TaxID=48485 RepID=A0A8H5DMK2_9HYPO|nr:hypothetical protein FANTH_14311 [Fusarium anthophilum]
MKKVLFTAPLIQGNAKDWFEPILRDYLENEEIVQDQETINIFADWRNFESVLKDNFGVWDDEALMEVYYRGLKEEVKDELYKADRPDNITEYVAMAIKIDERQYERRKERSAKTGRGGNFNLYYPN